MPRIDAERYLEHLLAKSRSIETHELPDPEVSTPLNTASQVSDYIVSAVLSVTQDCLTISLDRPWSQVGSPDKTIVELVGKSVQFEPPSESDNSIQIHHVGTYLKNAGGNWEIGAVIVRTLDGSAYDWHLIELSPDEYLTDEGNEIDTAVDLETFVRQLLNPRLASPKRDKREFAEASHLSRLGHTDFEDAEGRLDRAYRLSCALDAHFAHLMTDPHTTYRWRGDWLRFYKLFANQTGDLGSEGRALIAVRLLSRVESCFASYPDELHQWLNGDPGMSESIKEFYRQSQMSPSFSAPTIATFVLQGDK